MFFSALATLVARSCCGLQHFFLVPNVDFRICGAIARTCCGLQRFSDPAYELLVFPSQLMLASSGFDGSKLDVGVLGDPFSVIISHVWLSGTVWLLLNLFLPRSVHTTAKQQ